MGDQRRNGSSRHASHFPAVKSLPLIAVLTIGGAAAFAHFSRRADGTPGDLRNSPAAVKTVSDRELAAYAPIGFDEIFVKPAGPKGMEFTEKARSLDGKKVQVKGFMVRYPHPDPALFVFNSCQMFLNFAEYRLADSLPPEAIHVITEVPEGKAYSFYKEEMILLGTIEYGPRTEMDGRISHVRLRLDHAIDAKTRAALSLEASLAMQRERLFNAERLKEQPPS
jgi:hypothetical protein